MGFMQKNFLTNIFIIISQESKFCYVYVYKTLGGKIKKKEKEKFFYEKNSKTSASMIRYIYSFSKKYSCTYIAVLLDSSLQQIAIERNINRKFAKILEKENLSIYTHKDWRIYSNLQDINQIKNDFSIINLDFIFSPYAILYYLYTDSKKGDSSLYVLVLPSVITMAIFKKSICVSNLNSSRIFDNTEEDEQYDLEDFSEAEDDFDVQDNADDSGLELDLSYDEYDEDDSSIENGNSNEDADTKNRPVLGALEQELVNNIQLTINNFYKSSYYKDDEDLIDNIVIFNDGSIDSKVQSQIKESTMFDIFSKNIKFSDIAYKLMQKSL